MLIGRRAPGDPIHGAHDDFALVFALLRALERENGTVASAGGSYPRKCTSSGLILFACVQFRPCGAPSMASNLAPSTNRAVRENSRLDPFERGAVHTLRIVGRLQEKRRDGGHEHGFAYAVGSVLPQITGHLPAAHREADQSDITQVELRHELVQVLGEGVVVVPARRPAGPAEPSAVVCDDPVTCTEKRRDLSLPGCAAQRPAVDQHDGLAGSVILVVDLNRRRVLLTHSDGTQSSPPPAVFRTSVGSI